MREQDTTVLADSSEKWEMASVLMSSEEETPSRCRGGFDIGIRGCKKRMNECWQPFAHGPWEKMIDLNCASCSMRHERKNTLYNGKVQARFAT